MTRSAFHRLKICVATIGLVAASESHAVCTPAPCVKLTMNANVHLANLHPLVTYFQVSCNVPGSLQSRSAKIPIVNRGYVGVAPGEMEIPTTVLATQPNHTVRVQCNLVFFTTAGSELQWDLGNSVDHKSDLQSITTSNWAQVAAGSGTVPVAGKQMYWIHDVSFPTAAAP